MSGPETVADALVAHLAATMPDELAGLAAELGVPAPKLPAPKLISPQERDLLNLAEWPAMFVVVQRLEALRRVDGPNDDGTVTYRARYPVRVFVFVREKGYEATDLLRKRYVAALRAVLFAGQEAVDLDERSYTESYSDVGEDDNKRTIAGAYADFAVEVDEHLARRAPTMPDELDGWDVELDLAVLPHPALD